jgi:putative ABC transport system permease protein
MIADGDKIDSAAVKTFGQRKDSAIVSAAIMRNMNWKIGQAIVVHGTKYPRSKVPLTIVGELPAGQLANFYFRQDYLEDLEPARAIVNAVVLKMQDAKDADAVATAINEQYAHRQPAVKVETESASVMRFAARGKSILSLVQLVSWVLLIDMAIILSNSISISVRERRVEMAVLKVLGFQPLHIMALVIGEAILIGGISGVSGTGFVYLISNLTAQGQLPVTIATRFFIQFPVSATAVGQGLVLGMVVGLTGSVFPALGAQNVKVSDVFARIA